MFANNNSLAFPNITAFAEELTACSKGKLKIKDSQLELNDKALGGYLPYYQQIGSITPDDAFLRVFTEVVLPLKKIDKELFENGIDLLAKRSDLLGVDKLTLRTAANWLEAAKPSKKALPLVA